MSIKDNFNKALKKELTKASLEKGAPTAAKMKQMLKNSKDVEIDKEEEVEEATGAASAGGFVAPLGADPRFKKKEKKEEFDEATGASSAGSYVTPQMWAKDEKNWRGKAKTTWPGGNFVKVKKRCSTFPYCNQGDINALDLTENEKIKKAIKEVSQKTGKSKKYVKELVKKEIEEIIKRSFYKSPITSILGPETKMDKPIGKIYSMGSNVGGKYE